MSFCSLVHEFTMCFSTHMSSHSVVITDRKEYTMCIKQITQCTKKMNQSKKIQHTKKVKEKRNIIKSIQTTY